MQKALVIGAGNTGRIIIDNLVRSKKIETIYLYNRRKFKVEHIKEEISPISPEKEVIILESGNTTTPIKIKKVDLIFICASDYRADQRAEDLHKSSLDRNFRNDFRMAELQQNRNVMQDMVRLLKNIRGARIYVVSNPVDIFTNYLARNLDASNSIFGFGLALDILRIKHILRKKSVLRKKVGSIECVGNHGQPVPLLAAIMKNPKKQLYDHIQSQLKEHFVKASLGGVTYFQWSHALSELVSGATGERDFETGLCVKSSFEEFKNMHIGLPIQFRKGRVLKKDLVMSEFESSLLRGKLENLKKEIDKLEI